jgi:hypothetical protein
MVRLESKDVGVRINLWFADYYTSLSLPSTEPNVAFVLEKRTSTQLSVVTR